LRKVKRTHQGESEKPTLVFLGVPATNPVVVSRLTSVMPSDPPRSSRMSMAEVIDCSCTDSSAASSVILRVAPETDTGTLTNNQTNSLADHETVASSLRAYTIAVLSPGCSTAVCDSSRRE
jgi:hypothetical protein